MQEGFVRVQSPKESALLLRYQKIESLRKILLSMERLTFLIFFCALSSAGAAVFDSEGDSSGDPRPPLKKIKLDEDRHVGEETIDHVCVDKHTATAEKIFKKLQENPEKGCCYSDLTDCLTTTRKGPRIVLEAVVDMMFKANRSVVYNFHQKKYWLDPCAAPQESTLCDLQSAVAYVVAAIDNPKELNAGTVGYFLFHKGFRVMNFSVFQKIYYGVCLLCKIPGKEVLQQVPDFLAFARTSKNTLFSEVLNDYVRARRALYHEDFKGVSGLERVVAKYIWGLSQEDLDNIQQAKKDALRHKLARHQEEQRSLNERERFLESLLQWNKDAFPGQGTSKETQRECALEFHLSVAQVVQCNEIKTFEGVKESMQLWRNRHFSHVELWGAYETIRVLCSENVCAEQEHILAFVDFVKRHTWPANTTLEDQLERYQGFLAKEAIAIAENILAMDDAVLHEVQAIKIPWTLCRKVRAFLWLCSKSREEDLVQKLYDCACHNDTLSYQEITPLLKSRHTGFLESVRQVLDAVFSEGLMVDVLAEAQAFQFSLPGCKPKIYVPMEVLIAARFMGKSLWVKDKVLFVARLYCAGYTLRTLQEFFDKFDATCVVCDIKVERVGCVEKCRNFWRYIKTQPMRANVRDYCNGYPEKNRIFKPEIALMDKVMTLNDRNVFEAWGLGGIAQETLTLVQYQNKKEDLVVKILEEYGRHEAECSEAMLGLIFPCVVNSVLATVVDIACKKDLNVVYNKGRRTCALQAGPNMRPIPQESLRNAVFQYITKNPKEDANDVAYALYKAGYREGFDVFEKMHKICGIFLSPDGAYVAQRSQRFVAYAVDKMRTGLCRLEHLASSYQRNYENFAHQEAIVPFGRRVVELLLQNHLSSEEWGEMVENRRPFCQAPCEEEPRYVVSLSLEKIGWSNACILWDAISKLAQGQAVCGYKDLAHCAQIEPNPTKILELVMDCVFTHKLGVVYTKGEESYRFSLEGLHRREHGGAQLVMEQGYSDVVCTSKERAECAYLVHQKGYGYDSFKHFSQDFGAVCVVKNIAVEGMDDIRRSQDFWRYMSQDTAIMHWLRLLKKYVKEGHDVQESDRCIIKRALDIVLS